MSHIDLGHRSEPLPSRELKSPKSGGVLGVFQEFVASLSGLFGLNPSKQKLAIEHQFKVIEQGNVTADKVAELATLLRSRPSDISPLRAHQMRFSALQKLFAAGDYESIVTRFADSSRSSEREIWCRAYDQVKKNDEALALKYFLLRYAPSSYVSGQDSFERLMKKEDVKHEAATLLANRLNGDPDFDTHCEILLNSHTHPLTIYRTWLQVLQQMMKSGTINPAILEGCHIFTREADPYCAAARMLFDAGAGALGSVQHPQIAAIRRMLGTPDEALVRQVEALARSTSGPAAYYFGLAAELLRVREKELGDASRTRSTSS